MPWDNSDRRAHLPPDWPARRERVRARARDICEWTDDTGARCTDRGTECHHLGDRDDHRDEMLQWICRPHHKAETQRQARAAQHDRYVSARKRAPEAHPGIPRPS